MTFAQFGPLTAWMESAASAVGAGMLLGGFATGVVGLALRWPKAQFESHVVSYGYGGGGVGALTSLADITFR